MNENKNKSWIWCTAAFGLTVVIMLLILRAGGFYPFGEKSLLIMDMKGQYVEFLSSLRHIFTGDDSLFFSWSRSMGGNFIGVFAYYVASPLSFITLFFPVEKMPVAVEILTILKIALAAVTCTVFGNYLARRKGVTLGMSLLIPAVCYSLMSYTMVYSLSIMWLDAVILLPLILMGVEKILDGKQGGQYVLCLTLLFISNYYTGYMVGLFTGMYFVVRLITQMEKGAWKNTLGILGKFTLTSLISIGLAAPLLVSSLTDLMQGKLASGYQGTDYAGQTNFEFSKFWSKLSHGTYDSITNSGLPAVYCGYLILVLAVVYLLHRSIRIREKVGMLCILLLLMTSFYRSSLDKIWHGFQYPNWFPYRYAFLFSALLVYMAVQAMIALTPFFAESFFAKKHDRVVKTVVVAVLVVAVSAEMGTNGLAMLRGLDGEFSYGTVEEYTSFVDKTQPLVEQIQSQDSGFYRINQQYEYSKNDALLLGYNGMTHYSSTFNAAINALTPKLGLAQTYFWNSGYGSNALLDSLFAVKYVISDRAVASDYQYGDSTQEGTAWYTNPNALPIAYGVSGDCEDPDVQSASPFANQNQFVDQITGEKERNYFWWCEYVQNQEDGSSWNYQVTAASTNPMYLYMKANASYANVYVNDVYVGDYFTSETNGVLYLGNFEKGQTVTVRVAASSYDGSTVTPSQTEIAQLDSASVTETMTTLAGHGMKIKKHRGGSLKGTISLAEGQSQVMTSIPYDKGWTIKVDGKNVSYEKYAGTFIRFTCDSGEHEISMHYVSPGFGVGCVVAVISLLVCLVYFGVIKKWILTCRKTAHGHDGND